MRPAELEQKLFKITENEKKYRQGSKNLFVLNTPTEIIDGQEVLKLSGPTISRQDTTIISSPIIVKRHSRFQEFPLHYHDWIEFIYVYSGTSTQVINNQRYELPSGCTLLLDSDTLHTIEPLDENDILINIFIRKEYLNSQFFSRLSAQSILTNFFLNSIISDTSHNNFIVFQSQQSQRLPLFMKEFLCEWYDPSYASTEILNSLFTLIISELMNIYRSNLENSDHPAKKNSVIPILSYIEDNYQNCTLSSTAAHFNMNANYLSSLLKKHTGSSFKILLQEKKISYAAQLLKNTDLTITEIANLSGYENVSFFYKKFQEIYGCLPGVYRDQNKAVNNNFI